MEQTLTVETAIPAVTGTVPAQLYLKIMTIVMEVAMNNVPVVTSIVTVETAIPATMDIVMAAHLVMTEG